MRWRPNRVADRWQVLPGTNIIHVTGVRERIDMDTEEHEEPSTRPPATRHDRTRVARLMLMIGVLGALALVGGKLAIEPSSPSPSVGLSLLRDRAPTVRPSSPVAGSGTGVNPGARSLAEIDRLLSAMEASPESGELYRDLGFAYLQRARDTGDPSSYPSAEEAFSQSARRLPDDPLVLVGQGGLQLARHEFAKAFDTGSAALKLAPGFPAAQAVVIDALVELGRYEEALVVAEAMLVDDSLPAWNRTSYLRELHGDLAGALAAMEEAAVRGADVPENAAFTFTLVGTLNAHLGRADRATIVYDKALAFFPGYGPALAGKARLAIAQGDLAEGVRLFERAVEILPLAEYVIGLGEAQEAAGDLKAAKKSYELATFQSKLFQANGVVVDVELALFEADHGDVAKALEYARKAYADRENVKTADTLGWAHFKTGQYDEAARYSAEALRLGSKDPWFLYHAGAIAAARGETSAARAYLTEALDIDAGFSATGAADARSLLDQLE